MADQRRKKRWPRRVLVIGGSDSGGSAGIQADLKTLTAHGVFGTSALTVVTAQNTVAVQQAMPLPLELIEAQISTVLSDIGADAIKTGLLGRPEVVALVAAQVTTFRAQAGPVPLVVDPVLVSASGVPIVSPETVERYRQQLFPLATIITPNLDEACWLVGADSVKTVADLYALARHLLASGLGAVLIKGGHLSGDQKVDLFCTGNEFVELTAPALPLENPHGVGCTFASAIAAVLAGGGSLLEAVINAHAYLHRALAGALEWQLGQGRLPVNHFV